MPNKIIKKKIEIEFCNIQLLPDAYNEAIKLFPAELDTEVKNKIEDYCTPVQITLLHLKMTNPYNDYGDSEYTAVFEIEAKVYL